jgi:hypothetical protein
MLSPLHKVDIQKAGYDHLNITIWVGLPKNMIGYDLLA